SNRTAQSEISIPDQTILWWGGLRGSVSIALALSIPIILPEREKVIATVFGVVLFTLLVQGLTIQPLLKKLNLLGNQPRRQRYVEAVARQTALQRVMHYLETIEKRPGLDPEFYRYQMTLVQGELSGLDTQIERLLDEHPDLQNFVVDQVRSELQSIEAETYAEFVRAGQLNRELSPFLQQAAESKD
ncbi:MAG: cation:proton antiporter, partial [Phormidesmis sp. CAN_BIN44]|nr:cation:proton antiporter [Phormidesmis sp. CAN_BIN44]